MRRRRVLINHTASFFALFDLSTSRIRCSRARLLRDWCALLKMTIPCQITQTSMPTGWWGWSFAVGRRRVCGSHLGSTFVCFIIACLAHWNRSAQNNNKHQKGRANKKILCRKSTLLGLSRLGAHCGSLSSCTKGIYFTQRALSRQMSSKSMSFVVWMGRLLAF